MAYRYRRLLAAAAVVPFVLTACGDDDGDGAVTTTSVADGGATTAPADGGVTTSIGDAGDVADELADRLDESGLSSLASLVRSADVTAWLPESEFTFFAPNDDALRDLESEELRDLLSDPAQVVTVLENHVLEGTLTSADLAGATTVTTRIGEEIEVSGSGDDITVGGAQIVEADIEVGDGVVHVIDGVLVPPSVG